MSLSKGIIVGCCSKMEYLLPYFYLNFRLNSDFPIVFFDFGMTAIGRSFCEKRGSIVDIEDTLYESFSNDTKAHIKTMWFKKPLAFKKAPFDINLWLDLDCKILKPFDQIFEHLGDNELAMYEENPRSSPSHVFNSGVCLFKKNAAFIDPWITLSKSNSHEFRGDQDILTRSLKNHLDSVTCLPQNYNHIYLQPGFENPTNIFIMHYIAIFKRLLLNEYLVLDGLTQRHDYEPNIGVIR